MNEWSASLKYSSMLRKGVDGWIRWLPLRGSAGGLQTKRSCFLGNLLSSKENNESGENSCFCCVTSYKPKCGNCAVTVFSLDYVSPGVWITNVFLRKISWKREFCFYHPRFMLNTLVKIKKSWFGRGLQKMNFIFWCCYEGRLYSLMNMTYTIISLAIMWLIAIMNKTMMIMRSMRKITIKSILPSWL